MSYLKGLHGTERERAFDYICKAPEEVTTPLRRALDETRIDMKTACTDVAQFIRRTNYQKDGNARRDI